MNNDRMTALKRQRRRPVALLFCCLLLSTLPIGPHLFAAENLTPRDPDEAWKWMEEALKHAGLKDLTMADGRVTGQMPNGPFVITFMMVSSVKPVSDSGNTGVEWYEFPNVSTHPGHIYWRNAWRPTEPSRDARRFEAALNFLARKAQQDWEAMAAAKFEDFKLKAAAWRRLATKPEMPEEAHRHQVLAEHAFQSKDVGKAILEYGAALQVFPCWPEGHYNLAMLAAESGGRPGYDIAVHQMKEYLELVPEASDARAAKDSIIIWEDKR